MEDEVLLDTNNNTAALGYYFPVLDSGGGLANSSTTPIVTLILDGVETAQTAAAQSVGTGIYYVSATFTGIQSTSDVAIKVGNVTVGGSLQTPAVVNLPVREQLTESGIAAAVAALVSAGSTENYDKIIERPTSDTNPIYISWPATGAAITVERAIDGAAFEVATGSVAFFRTEGSTHWYRFNYDAADRPSSGGLPAAGTVRYQFTDGTTTRYLTLQTSDASVDASAIWSNPSRTLTAGVDLIASAKSGVADAVASQGDIATMIARFTGITSLASWLRAMVRSDSADATAKSEINTSGGLYDETTDSQQAVRDAIPSEVKRPEAY